MRRLLGIVSILGLIGLSPIKPFLPNDPVQAQDTNHLTLHVDGSTFFVDDEYFGDRLSGYTLPGFVLQPKVEWAVSEDFTLGGGVHWLHYWGASGYPATQSYGAHPQHDSLQRTIHLLPWLQATVSFSPSLTLTMGCLNTSGHRLPLPLYNPELLLVADPETGFELSYTSRWLDMEVWTDWREYIWDRSPVPERFTAGASGELGIDHGRWRVYVPLHLVAQHEGGQNMSVPHNINNNFNGAAGLGVSRGWNDERRASLDCRAMWYRQHGNAAVPFQNGWGLYPEITYSDKHWSLVASYWYGKDFVPLLGSWHFSNLSANTEGLTFDRTRVLTLHASWAWKALSDSYNVQIYGTLYHYLPSTGTLTDGTTRHYGHRNQVAVGASVSFSPTVKLY